MLYHIVYYNSLHFVLLASLLVGNVERGWNDPPMLLHTADGAPPAVTPPRRNPLTKRVFHTGITGPGPSPGGTPPAGPIPVGSTPPKAGVGPPPLVPVVPQQPSGDGSVQVFNPSNVNASSSTDPGPAIFTPVMSTHGAEAPEVPAPDTAAPAQALEPQAPVATTLQPATGEVVSLNPGDSGKLLLTQHQ